MNVVGNTQANPVGAVNQVARPAQWVGNSQTTNFKDVLDGAIGQRDPLQFSKHANMRLNARSITLTGDQLARVENGVSKANEKGIRDSLVLVDNIALVVNIKSRIVVTAMNQDSENIFSNIDGAVIV